MGTATGGRGRVSPSTDMANRKIVILGGALSGPTAAARARETDANAKIIVLERAKAISYAVGGLPYYLSGEVDSRGDIAPHRAAFFRKHYRVEVRTGVSVVRFDADKRKVYTDAGVVPYDSLIYALGAGSVIPPVLADGGANLSLLRNPAHLARIDRLLARGARRVSIVGGGYYGVEAADCLARRGCAVTLIERGPQLLPAYSRAAAGRAAEALRAAGVDARIGAGIDEVSRRRTQITALTVAGERIETELVLVTAGVKPRTEIFAAAGGRLLADASIRVDDRCTTHLEGVYATSICVSHTHAITRRPVWTAQASDADKTAQVAGTNAAGGEAKLGPTLGTSILRAGDLHLARTGLTELDGKLGVRRVQVSGHARDPFFRGSAPLDITLYYAAETERVVGAEVVGGDGVDKRIDVLATAALGKLRLEQLAQLDLAYSPPYSTARDIVNATAVVGRQAQEVRAWTPEAFAARGEDVRVYDLRPSSVRREQPLESAKPIALAKLGARRRELKRAKQVVFVCESGRSSSLAARTAKQFGSPSPGYLSGGTTALAEA